MANEQYAFIKKSNVPDRARWQEAIAAAGFDFELHSALQPYVDSGFVPCTLHGRPTGFEITYAPAVEIFEDAHELAGDRDYCIAFRWGGDMAECASVQIATYALAKDFDAIVSYEGDAPYDDLDAFLAEAKSIVKDALGT